MNLNEFLNKLIINRKIYIILIIFAIVGIVLLSFEGETDVVNNSIVKPSSFVDDNITKQDNPDLEQKLKKILAKVEGVGEVDVFINFKKDSVNKLSVFPREESLDSETKLDVEGVIVVAQGGGKSEIVSIIRNSVSETFGIPLHKVIVLKMSE